MQLPLQDTCTRARGVENRALGGSANVSAQQLGTVLAEKDFRPREAPCFTRTCNQLSPGELFLGTLTLLQFCGTSLWSVLPGSSFMSSDSPKLPSPGQEGSSLLRSLWSPSFHLFQSGALFSRIENDLCLHPLSAGISKDCTLLFLIFLTLFSLLWKLVNQSKLLQQPVGSL